jgi:hypothetical protein
MKEDAQIYLAIEAAELNSQLAYTGDSITQEQFDIAVREAERIWKRRKSGKYRVMSVDSWEFGSDIIRGNFDSEEEATIFAYWEAHRERDFWEWAKRESHSRSAGKTLTQYKRLERYPPSDFVQNIEQEKRRIQESPSHTSEVLYVYDPEGNLVDKIKV